MRVVEVLRNDTLTYEALIDVKPNERADKDTMLKAVKQSKGFMVLIEPSSVVFEGEFPFDKENPNRRFKITIWRD